MSEQILFNNGELHITNRKIEIGKDRYFYQNIRAAKIKTHRPFLGLIFAPIIFCAFIPNITLIGIIATLPIIFFAIYITNHDLYIKIDHKDKKIYTSSSKKSLESARALIQGQQGS